MMERYGHGPRQSVQEDVRAARAGDPAAVERLSRRGRAGALKANAVKAEKKAQAAAEAEEAAVLDEAIKKHEEEQRLEELARLETVRDGEVGPPEVPLPVPPVEIKKNV